MEQYRIIIYEPVKLGIIPIPFTRNKVAEISGVPIEQVPKRGAELFVKNGNDIYLGRVIRENDNILETMILKSNIEFYQGIEKLSYNPDHPSEHTDHQHR